MDDLTPSGELTARVEAIPSSRAAGVRRRLGVRGRRIAFAVPVSIVAIVAAVVTLFGGSDVTPSYAGAVLVLPNGEVRVTISQIMDVPSANTELRAHRIHNMVVRPMSASCPEHPSMSYMGAAKVPAPKITLTPRTAARGWTIVIAAEQIGPNLIEQAIGRFRGRVPRCISSHGTGPGLGNWKPTKADKANYRKAAN
ncbi:MAG TPA: hypothetical protein VGK33_03490 [Chloroflexota bacterium]